MEITFPAHHLNHLRTHLIDNEVAHIGRIAIVAENLVAGDDEATRHDNEQVAEVLRSA